MGSSFAKAPDTPNYRYYESPGVAEFFATFKTTLFGAEAVILHSLAGELHGQPILEIGVGGGRLVPYLQSVSANYIGVDFSEKMIELCRNRFKNTTFITCDARKMGIFGNGQFAAVFFTFNGIDEVSPSDRLMVLAECRRVLRQNGAFVFSSHNLDWMGGIFRASVLEGVDWRRWYRMIDTLRLRVLCRYFLSSLANWIVRPGYAVLPFYDWPSPRMASPLFWIKKEAQEKQLLSAGFTQINTLLPDGDPCTEENRRRDFMLFYSARKK